MTYGVLFSVAVWVAVGAATSFNLTAFGLASIAVGLCMALMFAEGILPA